MEGLGTASRLGSEDLLHSVRGSLHSVRGSIGLGLETLVIGSQVVYFCLFLAFIIAGLCLYFYCYCLKLLYTLLLLIQSYIQYLSL